MNPAKPIRRRVLATAETVKAPSAELVSLAAQVMQANTEMNASKKRYDDLRKKLLVGMKEGGFRDFHSTALVNGKTISFEAKIAATTRDVIDVGKLRKLVTDDVFMQCVSASKSAVEAAAGNAVATQCANPTTGEENVSVKPVK